MNFDTWLPFEVDITDYVKRDGTDKLLVGLRHNQLFEKNHPDYKYFGATFPSGSNTE
ncbi:hypothetical protein EZS27_040581, partial [termite gut metagenome]